MFQKPDSLLLGCFVAALAVGCSDTQSRPAPWNLPENEPAQSCDGDAPTCDDGCGGTVAADCIGGAWECPTFADGGACWPSDPPVEENDDCSDQEALCSAICGDAWAECIGGEWVCQYSDEGCEEEPPDVERCQTFMSSTLPGVTIEISDDVCYLTTEEVAQGIGIPYTITIEQPLKLQPAQQASCPAIEESQLLPFELIEGNDQRYCVCDSGLCPEFGEVVELVPGTYERLIEWDGRNWDGPSDTGMPKGEPFPPGAYDVTVSAIGTTEDGAQYEVFGTLVLHLL